MAAAKNSYRWRTGGMNNMPKPLNQRGFTILELMIATVVFSVLLMGAATLLVQIGRLYYKGIVNSRTQETVRNITDDIGRTLQFSGEAITRSNQPYRDFPTANGAVRVYSFCIGSTRYSYILDGQVSSTVNTYVPGENRQNFVPHAMWRDQDPDVTSSNCEPKNIIDSGVISASGGREMLGENMRLYRLVPPSDTDDNLASFAVGVVFGQDDGLITFTDTDGQISGARCRGSGIGAQWCATSELQTTVFRRID